ncbi:ATP-dependent DNA helicase RecG [Candidatus Bathyarchaeota archaeon]|nr:ATP-dependent DNA helicase RecG [Candidatus Bathyarchaeota archaeon]
MTITLTTLVKELKGVGPSKAAALARLGVKTVDDLLHHYPTGYAFAPPVGRPPATPGGAITVVGEVVCIVRKSPYSRDFGVVLTGGHEIIWFGGQYLRSVIFKGSRLIVSGEVKRQYGGIMVNPAFKVLGCSETPNSADLNTVTYPITSGITSKDIGRLVWQVLPLAVNTHGTRPESIYKIYRPKDQAEADHARQVLKYNELFYMQLGLAVRQARREQVPPNVQCINPPQDIGRYFPFEFTTDQERAVWDVLCDLCYPHAMNRLLQGDVGCGKTAVAAYAAIVTAFNEAQTAILCPTEILARQHYETVKGYFERAGVSCRLVIGGYTKQRTNTDSPLMCLPNIIIGTTALSQDKWVFKNLGLVIIDEQHKFGVEQRAALRRHGNPHCLVMTATPIPRTIAMTVFGDLDISTIRSMPPGRRPVRTVWVNDIGSIWSEGDCNFSAKGMIECHLAAGHQVYVVCPRIEALDDEMRAVEEVAKEYRSLFPDASIMTLHGKRSSHEKQCVTRWWTDSDPLWRGVGRILVSTTVVEVGVDNPNATVMVIEGAERFGLAQLHQLRGRVGRGKDQSYCFLLSDTDSAGARSRLRIMEKTNDGFEIAEQDLRNRGPGDLLSTRQHGLPDLRIADLVEDYELMLEARKEARELVAKGPLPVGVQVELEKRFGNNLLLADV